MTTTDLDISNDCRSCLDCLLKGLSCRVSYFTYLIFE